MGSIHEAPSSRKGAIAVISTAASISVRTLSSSQVLLKDEPRRRDRRRGGEKGNNTGFVVPKPQKWKRLGEVDQDREPTRKGKTAIGVGPKTPSSTSPEKKSSSNQARKDTPKPVIRPPPPKLDRELPLPPFITVNGLAKALGIKLKALQGKMSALGHSDVRSDLLLPFPEAETISLELDQFAVPMDASSSQAYDVYPRPPLSESERAKAPLRPPVVTIMGHVDHGKTTLLDRLRSTSVAASEAGGITQHIGAFSVPVGKKDTPSASSSSSNGLPNTITFLDTPGHAAFSAMRSRGAQLTDVVVLVVAADDGVMPQTKEVIQVVEQLQADSRSVGSDSERASGAHGTVQLVVAINKVDKPESDVDKVKRDLLSAGVQLEDFGGDVPCVEISGKTGMGLDRLEETLLALSELAELRTEAVGPVEGLILESRVEKGRGNTATVLIKRGQVAIGDIIVAGTSFAKVRGLSDEANRAQKRAGPGSAVLVMGWRSLPSAGDEVLGVVEQASVGAELLAKKAVERRSRVWEQRRMGEDVAAVNEGRRIKAEEEERRDREAFERRQRAREARLQQDQQAGQRSDAAPASALGEAPNAENRQALELGNEEEDDGGTKARKQELRLVVKADFSGTVEAVLGAISGIGNADVCVNVVASGVGEPNENDIAMAAAVGQGQIIGFNVKPAKKILDLAANSAPSPVKVHCDSVIYRLMSHVATECANLLAPTIETRIDGEAIIAEVFSINLKGRHFRSVAGCRVTNGVLSRNSQVRVLRGSERKVIFQGKLDSLRQVKREVEEMRKGTECGLGFEGMWGDFDKGDVVQCFHTIEVPRKL